MKERAVQAILEAASAFINRESNRRSLITATRVELNERGGKVEIYISVFPEKDTHAATDFLNRNRDEFKQYLKKHVSLRNIPRVLFLAEPDKTANERA